MSRDARIELDSRPLMVSARSTTSRVIAAYNSTLGRPTLDDPVERAALFRAYGRLLAAYMPVTAARILDVACGEGHLLAFLRSRGYENLDGFDLSPENVMLCHAAGLTMVREADLLALDISSLRPGYDVIFALDVIEHLPKERVAEVLETLRLALAPGGTMIVQTPNMGSLFASLYRYNDLTHEHGLTEKTLAELLQLVGYAPEAIEIRGARAATTAVGRARELYAATLHNLLSLAIDAESRPRHGEKNLLARARVPF